MCLVSLGEIKLKINIFCSYFFASCRRLSGSQGDTRNTQRISKVNAVDVLCSKYTRALTFEKFWAVPGFNDDVRSHHQRRWLVVIFRAFFCFLRFHDDVR
jgi:hypothetical protein